MTSLNIQQSTQSSETVSSAVIEKLYNLAIISTVEDENSTLDIQLTGSIYANAAYETSVLYLREKFPQLTINIRDNNYYIKFADPLVEQALVGSLYCSDGVGFSLNDASLMTRIPKNLFNYTQITTFDELNKFGAIEIANEAFDAVRTLTSINLSTVTSIGQYSFRNCSSLSQTINCPNLTSIGEGAFKDSAITGVTSIGDTISQLPNRCFENCSSLTAIVLPQNISTIGGICFSNDTNLTSFDFSNISTINNSAFANSGISGTLHIPNLAGVLNAEEFRNCTNITSVTSLGTITSISYNAREGYSEGTFQGCSGLTSVVIPNTVTSIGADAFANCNNLTNVTCDWTKITTLKRGAFSISSNWNFIMPLLNLTTLSKDAFTESRYSRVIKQIYMPKIVYAVRDGYYTNNNYFSGFCNGVISDIVYLRDIEKLYPGAFTHSTIINLVINNTTPPTWCNQFDQTDQQVAEDDNFQKKHVFAQSNITNIYVPDSAVSTYTSDSDWSTVADKIKPLSQLTKVATEADLQEGQIALIEAYM